MKKNGFLVELYKLPKDIKSLLFIVRRDKKI